MKLVWKITIPILTGLTLLILVIILGLSIKKVEFDQYAVVKNKYTIKIYPDVLGEGRVFLYPGDVIYIFPRLLQTIEMTNDEKLFCRTSEGLEMTLDITFQYQLEKEKLLDTFLSWNDASGHSQFIRSLTRDTIKDVCGEFSGEDFFNRRGDIASRMLEDLQFIFSNTTSNSNSKAILIQLRNVMHPPEYEQANQDTEEVSQERGRALSEREQQITDATTELRKAEANANIRLTEARGIADATVAEARERAQADFVKWQQRGKAFASVKTQLGSDLTNDEFIKTYLKYYAVRKHSNNILNIS